LNNFATGLVRRSAGLTFPAAVRPALGAANIPHAAELTEPTIVGPKQDAQTNHDVTSISAEPATPRKLMSAPTPPAPSETRRIVEAPPVSREERIPLQPRMDTFPPSIAGNDSRSAPVTQPELPSLIPARISQPPVWQEPSAPTSTPIEPRPAPGPNARPTVAHLPEPVRASADLSPKPESLAALEETVAAGPENASANHGRSPEVRNIQVKIGKVEIRSTQPVSVAPAPRPTRTSGFDDLRLARTYLDRGVR
jgi:hypothetical protein